MSKQRGPISQFIEKNYLHFNAAALMDAAKGYETHLDEGGKMMITLAGAMSTAELGISLAEMIRQDKVSIISCTGANLEEDIMNLVAHSHYKRVPNYRDLSPQDEWDLLEIKLTEEAEEIHKQQMTVFPLSVMGRYRNGDVLAEVSIDLYEQTFGGEQ